MKLHEKKVLDFDPEDDLHLHDATTSGSESDSEGDGLDAGREHYEIAATSKLRKPARVELSDEKYNSRPVSRALFDDNEDFDPLAPQEDSEEDPFAAQDTKASLKEDDDSSLDVSAAELNGDIDIEEDEEIDSDDAFGSGDEETFKSKGFKFRGSGGMLAQEQTISRSEDGMSDQELGDSELSGLSQDDLEQDSDNDSDIAMDDFDDDNRSEGTDEDSDGSETNDDEQVDRAVKPKPSSILSQSATDREKLRNLISSDTATISASLSQAASADAKKGNTVKQQYQAFDRLLDARIRLQKGLMAANDMATFQSPIEENIKAAAQRAEQAALQLFTTIETIRNDILDTQPIAKDVKSKKRKRQGAVTASTPVSDLHGRLNDLEEQSVPHRRNVLDRWANKTRAANPSKTSRSKLEADQTSSKLTTILDAHLFSSGPKLVQDSQTPVPVSTPAKTHVSDNRDEKLSSPSLPVYQDTLFYQSLLRDLISTRSYISPSAANTSSAALTYSINDKIALPAKIHRQVDRKASKGRKVRYTVHEKLENFTASTGRQSAGDQWTESAVREFFGSLMGMRNQLAEYSDEDAADQGDGQQDNGSEKAEVEALRLFRS